MMEVRAVYVCNDSGVDGIDVQLKYPIEPGKDVRFTLRQRFFIEVTIPLLEEVLENMKRINEGWTE